VHDLRGQCAILTGASRGIGPHIARALSRAGVHLALAARSAPELDALARELAAGGARALPIATDLASAAGREALVARAEAELGPIDILVNNAGADRGGALHTRAAADVEEVAQINLVAPIELTRRLLPSMLARRRGHFVHVASLAGKVPLPFFALYSATKYGIVGFNHALQAELRGTGVRSSAVCPGFVSGEGMWARLGGRVHPALGISTPEQVARAVLAALEHGRIEQIVNPRPVRPVVAVWGVAPRAGATLFRWLRVNGFVGRAVGGADAARGRTRG
jgi:short-subunit dehydrogenase